MNHYLKTILFLKNNRQKIGFFNSNKPILLQLSINRYSNSEVKNNFTFGYLLCVI